MMTLSKRRKSVKVLWPALVVATVLGCSALGYAVLHFGRYGFSESPKEEFPKQEKLVEENKCIPVCDSKECVEQSNMLLHRIDTTVDPCENFLEFACRKHLEKLNPNKTETGLIYLMSEMRKKLKVVLDNIQADPESASGKLKMVYDSCMKRDSDLKAIPTVLKFLAEFGIPDWPNLQPDFKFDDPSRLSVLSHFIAYQQFGFFRFERLTESFHFHRDTNLTVIDTGENFYKRNDEPLRRYLVEQILQYFDLDTETIEGIWRESEAITNATSISSDEYNYDEIVNMPDAEIDCAKPQVKWKVVCELMDKFVEIVGVADVERYAEISKYNFYYMENILSRLASFSDRSIANYLVLNLLMKNLDELSFYFRLKYQKDPEAYDEYLGVATTEIDSWQHCVEWQIKNMYIPLAHEYAKAVFSIPVILEVEDFIGEIIHEIADEVYHQKWISETVRDQMVSMTKNITLTISTVRKVILNETIINELYKKFHPVERNFMHNVFEYQRYSNVVNMLVLRKAYGINWFKFESLLTPSAYVDEGNIDTEFGILLPPVYRIGLNRLMNLVSLSTVMAHEVGHTLQLFQMLFHIMDPIAEKKMIEETLPCLIDQYSKFKFESIGKNMNGSYYLKENFADLIGIQIIDKLIEKYANTDKAASLPGFSNSLQQQLYITAMQMWCAHHTKRDEEYNSKQNYSYAIHSLFKFRMFGSVQNSKGFAKAFNCPEGTFMNPIKKCSFFDSED